MKIKLTLLAIILGLSSFWFWYEAPLKIKDPQKPGFKISKFRFIDYPDYKQREDVLNALLPAGTSKNNVDSLLVEIGGATSDGVNRYSSGFHVYRYRPWTLALFEITVLAKCSDYMVHVCYSENGQQVEFLRSSGPCLSGLLNNLIDPSSIVNCGSPE